MLAKGIKSVVVSNRNNDIYYGLNSRDIGKVHVNEIKEFENTNGCGDALFSGLIDYLLEGKSLKEATKIIQKKGFAISEEQVEQASDKIKEGYVIRTNPVAGTKRKKGYEVVLYVSLGDASIIVENYTGKNFSEVKGALESQKIKVLKEEQELEGGDVADENEIIGQSVEVGEKLSAGDTITLYVAESTKKYPNFQDGNYTESSIKAFAEENNLTVNIIYVEDETKENGTVVGQNKPEGYKIINGSSFDVKIVKNNEKQPDVPEDNDGSEWTD